MDLIKDLPGMLFVFGLIIGWLLAISTKSINVNRKGDRDGTV